MSNLYGKLKAFGVSNTLIGDEVIRVNDSLLIDGLLLVVCILECCSRVLGFVEFNSDN